MVGVRMVVLILRFVVELAMVTGLAYAGAWFGEGATAWVLAIALPVPALLMWWAFVAPKARRPVALGVRVAIELVLFGATSVLLAAAERPGWAMAYAIVSIAVSLATAATQGIRTPFDEPQRTG